MTNRVFLPEWASQNGILITIPHPDTDWNYILDDVIKFYQRLITEIHKSGEKVFAVTRNIDESIHLLSKDITDKVKFFEIPVNDTWIRDYGPISVLNADNQLEFLDFGFNAWGLKFAADKDNLVNKALACISDFMSNENSVNIRSFILEGGSIETDGEGTLLTTSNCLLSPNRNPSFTKSEIEEFFKSTLGIKKTLWLNHGYLAGDDTDSHIDTLARICPDNTIIYTGCADSSDEHYCELEQMRLELESFTNAKGESFRLLELPLPDAVFDSIEGIRLPATYANYLVLNDRILLPIYNQPKDAIAKEVLSKAYPEKMIVGIDSNVLIRQHGSLHCSTMQIPSQLQIR